MQRPPEGVRLVMEAVCIMFEVKPKKVAGEKPGQKIDDYWEPGKSLLQDPPKFISELRTYDKVASFIEITIFKVLKIIENSFIRLYIEII